MVTTQPDDLVARHAQNTQRYLCILNEMIDLAADVTRRAHRQFVAQDDQSQSPTPQPEAPTPTTIEAPDHLPPDDQPPDHSPISPDQTIPFDRALRALRQTISLAQKLSAPPASPPAATHPAATHNAGLRPVAERGGDLSTWSTAEIEEQWAIHHPENDDEADKSDRPAEEILGLICRDLQLDHVPDTDPRKRRLAANLASLGKRVEAQPPLHLTTRTKPPDK
jgi:hypothetical protein